MIGGYPLGWYPLGYYEPATPVPTTIGRSIPINIVVSTRTIGESQMTKGINKSAIKGKTLSIGVIGKTSDDAILPVTNTKIKL